MQLCTTLYLTCSAREVNPYFRAKHLPCLPCEALPYFPGRSTCFAPTSYGEGASHGKACIYLTLSPTSVQCIYVKKNGKNVDKFFIIFFIFTN